VSIRATLLSAVTEISEVTAVFGEVTSVTLRS